MAGRPHRVTTVCLTALTLLAVSPAAFAQWSRQLDTADDAATYCRFSAPSPDDTTGETDERYEAKRRRLVHRSMRVDVGAQQVPIVEYDRITGLLMAGTYGPIPLFDGYALKLGTSRPFEFELSEDRARNLLTRYRTGHARLRISFLPGAYANYDTPLCDESGRRTVINGELLSAEFIDEVGQTLLSYETELGREVDMMRSHDIQGFLHAALPAVSVTSIVPYGAEKQPARALSEEARKQLSGELQKSLYGCYLRGLTRNARLQGALVVAFRPRTDDPPRILVDSIQHPDVVSCAKERIARVARITTAGEDTWAGVKATVYFKLEDSGSL